jgi:hypothetical protein
MGQTRATPRRGARGGGGTSPPASDTLTRRICPVGPAIVIHVCSGTTPRFHPCDQLTLTAPPQRSLKAVEPVRREHSLLYRQESLYTDGDGQHDGVTCPGLTWRFATAHWHKTRRTERSWRPVTLTVVGQVHRLNHYMGRLQLPLAIRQVDYFLPPPWLSCLHATVHFEILTLQAFLDFPCTAPALPAAVRCSENLSLQF